MTLQLGNRLLDSLPDEELQRLRPHLESVALPRRTVLFEAEDQPRYIHFITSGMASIVTTMKDGEAIEVGLLGNEGFPEKLHLMGSLMGLTRCFMQIAGSALRMDFKRFEADFKTNPELLKAVQQYVQYETLVLEQIVACNRLHEVEPRLARWLLMVNDRVSVPEFHLTQEFIGEMLGVRRSSVNLAAGNLQRSGLISYIRGKIKICDRDKLQRAACECYPVIAKLFREFAKA